MAIPPRTPLLNLLKLERQQVAEMKRILSESSKELRKRITALETGGVSSEITRMQLFSQKAAIDKMLKEDFVDIQKSIDNGMKAAAAAASRTVSAYEDTLRSMVLTDGALKNLANSEARRAVSGLEAAMKRMEGSSYIPLSKQIYKTEKLAQGWVDTTINKALVQGWTWTQLADELSKSFNPNVPGGVSYAAARTARTEINNAFHATSAQRYLDSVIVEGVDWHLSSSHPEGDVCDTLQDESPYPKNRVPQKPHPFCYCFITPALPSEDEFLEKLFKGDYGDGAWVAQVSPAKAAKVPFDATKIGPKGPKLPTMTADKAFNAGVMQGEQGAIAAFDEIYDKGKKFNGFELKTYAAGNFDGKNMQAGLNIFDEAGKRVGTIGRTFTKADDGTWSVYHDLMRLDKEAQGKGFSTAFSKYSEQWYKANGIETIRVHAALDKGGYTWAKAGYDWDPEYYKKPEPLPPELAPIRLSGSFGTTKPTEIIQQMDRYLKSEEENLLFGNGRHIGEANMAELRAMRDKFESDDIADWPKPWEIANSGSEPIIGSKDKMGARTGTLGHALLDGLQWHGVKVLE